MKRKWRNKKDSSLIRKSHHHNPEGGRYRDYRRGKNTTNFEDLPSHESIYGRKNSDRWRFSHRGQFSTDVLKKWIISKVGCHIDDVYSEFCDRFPEKYRDKGVCNHCYGILNWYLDLDVYTRNGKLYEFKQYFNTEEEYVPTFYDKYYVHPETGIITKMPKKQKTYRYRDPHKEIIKKRVLNTHNNRCISYNELSVYKHSFIPDSYTFYSSSNPLNRYIDVFMIIPMDYGYVEENCIPYCEYCAKHHEYILSKYCTYTPYHQIQMTFDDMMRKYKTDKRFKRYIDNQYNKINSSLEKALIAAKRNETKVNE